MAKSLSGSPFFGVMFLDLSRKEDDREIKT
jgi:hypothetical protein